MLACSSTRSVCVTRRNRLHDLFVLLLRLRHAARARDLAARDLNLMPDVALQEFGEIDVFAIVGRLRDRAVEREVLAHAVVAALECGAHSVERTAYRLQLLAARALCSEGRGFGFDRAAQLAHFNGRFERVDAVASDS